MPSKKEYDAVFSKLKALETLIEQHAKNDLQFFESLKKILMSDAALISTQKTKTKRKEPILHILQVLHKNGESRLIQELGQLTNDQLATLANDEGIKRLAEAKKMDRNELITALVDTASSRLRQGESFTR